MEVDQKETRREREKKRKIGGKKNWGKKMMIPPRIELGTLSVLDSRDNHYTMEST